MTENVIISIRGKQLYAEGSPDEMELVTSGTLKRDGKGGYTISYQESELTGLEGTLTTIQVEGEQVTLMRVGEFNSQLVFQEGRRHLSMYNTPYGAMSIGVNTRHLLTELNDQGGRDRGGLRHRGGPRPGWPQCLPHQREGGRRGPGELKVIVENCRGGLRPPAVSVFSQAATGRAPAHI